MRLADRLMVTRTTDWLVTPGQLEKVGGPTNHQPISVSLVPVSTAAALQRPGELHFGLLGPSFGPDAVVLVDQGGVVAPVSPLLLEDAPLVLPPPTVLLPPTVLSSELGIPIQSLHALGFLARVVASDDLLHSTNLNMVEMSQKEEDKFKFPPLEPHHVLNEQQRKNKNSHHLFKILK